MSEKAMQQSAEAPQLDSAHPDSLPAAANPQQLLTLYTEALRFDSEYPGTCRPPDNLPAPASPQQLLTLFAETMAAETMARDTATTGQSLPPPWSDEHFAILWGPNWPGHPFRQPPLLWHKHLFETDVTQLVQLFCRDDFAGKLGWKRRKAFLRALWDVQDCHSTGAKLPQLPSDDNIYKRMRCIAEHPVVNESDSADTPTEGEVSPNEETEASNKNDSTGTHTRNMLRLDLFFSADKDKDGCEFHYAVEVKFGAPVDNDLEAYNSFVCKKYNPCRPPACCLKEYKSDAPECCLTVLGLYGKNISGKPQKNDNTCCFPIVEWHQFLKAWEVHLSAMNDSDPRFAQFRKSIWLKILERDYVQNLCYNSAHLQAVL